MRALALTALLGGCSLLHVKDDDPSCTFEHANTDVVMAGIFTGLSATMIVATENVQDSTGRLSDKAVFVAGYVLLLPAALFAVSATVGFRRVLKCRQY